MKLFVFLLIVLSSVARAEETKPLAQKDEAVAEFGELVVSKAFTYAKTVHNANGHKIVDVVIVDKLCHVTVVDSLGEMKATKIECDEGRYFPSNDTSN